MRRAKKLKFAQCLKRRPIWCCLVAITFIPIAVLASRASYINSVSRVVPANVDRLTDDPSAKLQVFQQTIENSLVAGVDEPTFDSGIAEIARMALRQNPLQTLPLSILAMKSSSDGKVEEAKKFELIAEKVTRRDIQTQLLLIKRAALANDGKAILDHIDTSLRVNPNVGSLLFPILGVALSDRGSRDFTAPYVRSGRTWIKELVLYAIGKGGDELINVTLLLLQSRANNWVDYSDDTGARLLNKLVNQGESGLARQLLAQLPDERTKGTFELGVTEQTTKPDFGVFAWTPLNGAEVGGFFNVDERTDKPVIEVFANSNQSGRVLHRVIKLRPGQYNVNIKRNKLEADEKAQSYWIVNCLQKLAPVEIWRSPSEIVETNFTISNGPVIPSTSCDMQIIELHLRGGDGQTGIRYILQDLDLSLN